MELLSNLNEDQMREYENTREPRTFRVALLVGTHSKFFLIDTAEQPRSSVCISSPVALFRFSNCPWATYKMSTGSAHAVAFESRETPG